jgi:hypothetical protein
LGSRRRCSHLMKKLATTSSSKQIPSYLGLTPKVQESGVELAVYMQD